MVVIVAMQFASITSQSGLLIWLVGLIAGCLVVNVVAAFRSVRNIKLRAPGRILVEEGSAPRDSWQLTNTGRRRARLITVECNDRIWLKASEIQPQETVSVVPRDVFKKRGVYSLDDAWLVSLFPFGLVKAMRDADVPTDILVYPKLEEVAAPEVRGLDPMIGGKHTGPGRIAAGANFAGIRPIQNGDSFKQIHWKSSAKGLGVMIKTYEEELAGRAALLVYCDPSSPHCEACINHAGSLAAAGIEAGHQIDFQNLNEGKRVALAPFGDSSALLEALARYEVGPKSLDHKALAAVVQSIRPRIAIHFVVTSLNHAVETQILDLLSRDKLVVLHMPRGRAPAIDCPIRYFPES